jgi:tetratricopeptide (TPR) repeat protein
MFAALGVGNQMIAVLPKSDMVIVNRANTYEDEATPTPLLLDLIEQVLEARTGTPDPNPDLMPLEEHPDPLITHVAQDRLETFVGEWDYPPSPLGMPRQTTVQITAGDGHLVSFVPLAGTFKLYLQEDGSLHEEDSHNRYLPVRTADGSFAGIADALSIMRGAVFAAVDGHSDRAQRLLESLAADQSIDVGVARATLDLLGGDLQSAEHAVRALAARADPNEVEMLVNALGYEVLRAERVERALEIFELNTRVFPEAFNTWDSLGEAHMMLGNDEDAIRAYERSLELNPENANATAMIARIRGGERP